MSILFLILIFIAGYRCDYAEPKVLNEIYFVKGADEILKCPVILTVLPKLPANATKTTNKNYINNNINHNNNNIKKIPSVSKYLDQIIKNTTVQFLKNGQPVHRDNGEFFLPPNATSRFEQVMHNVDKSDAGLYTCNYTFNVNSKMHEYYFFVQEQHMKLSIVDDKPTDNLITQPSTHEPDPKWTNIILYNVVFVSVVLIIVGISLKCIRVGMLKKEKSPMEPSIKPIVPIYDYPNTIAHAFDIPSLKPPSTICNPIYGLSASFNSVDLTKCHSKSYDGQLLVFLQKIGEGQFGEVHRCLLRKKDGSENHVAVKMLRSQLHRDTLKYVGSDRDRKDLIGEIEIMKLVQNHPYVVKIMEYFAKDNEPIMLVMELVENGKLQTYLRDSRTCLKSTNDLSSCITSRDLIKFSYQIAKGMEYVASKGIIHRDLASRNILITEDRVCKVADFGFARLITDECAYERTNGDKVPVRWMAPEALIENKFTSKSDVFSFGILIWEIVTLGSTPYENLTSQQVLHKVKFGERLDKPNHCKAELFEVMSKCWLHDPKDRPTFNELAIELEKLLLSENDYIELNQYPNHAYYNILTDKSDEKL